MSKVKDIVTGLTRAGTRELGKTLVAAAQEANAESLRGAVVGRVQEILVQLRKQRDYLESTEANIDLLKRKLAAVEAGEFSLSPYGVLTFNDPTLSTAVTSMHECPNCGYSGHRSLPAV